MSQPIYVYEGIIERRSGAIRLAKLPAESAPVQFGVHGAIAKHYGLNPTAIKEPASLSPGIVALSFDWSPPGPVPPEIRSH